MKSTDQCIKSQAEKCVYCGICSTTCPTYQISRIETESPRGRTVAMAHAADNKLPINARFKEQIHHCLQCGLCERVCPVGIKITELISLQKHQFRTHFKSIIQSIWQRSTWLLLGFQLLRSLRIFGLLAYFFTPKNHVKPSKNSLSYSSIINSKIGLFIGCTGRNFDHASYQATRKVLSRLGIHPIIPKTQTCCGSLDFHEGDLSTFDKLQYQNRQTLKQTNIQTYLYFTSGCRKGLDAMTKDYDIQAIEIIDFLSGKNLDTLKFMPLDQTVFVHVPCTHNDKNAVKKISHILSHIPNIRIQILPDGCCGSAGLHAFKYPHRADKLRREIIQSIEQPEPIIVSTNIGCALHLARGFDEKNATIAHPISLLYRQLI